MGLAKFLSGMLFGSPDKQRDRTQYSCSKEDIRKIVSRTNVRTLDKEEVEIVEHTIDEARRGDGKISMFQVDEALRKLVNMNKISKHDYQGLMQMFAIHMAKKKYKK